MKRVSLVLVCLLVFSGLAVAAKVSLLSLGDAPGQWEVSIGKGALDGAIKAMEQEGEAGVEMFYSHPAQLGFDYIDYNYIPQSPLNVLLKTIRVRIDLPADPDQYLELFLYDASGGVCSFTFPTGQDKVETFTLRNWDFQVWTGGFNFTEVTLIRFRSIGDAGTKATTGRYVLYELGLVD